MNGGASQNLDSVGRNIKVNYEAKIRKQEELKKRKLEEPVRKTANKKKIKLGVQRKNLNKNSEIFSKKIFQTTSKILLKSHQPTANKTSKINFKPKDLAQKYDVLPISPIKPMPFCKTYRCAPIRDYFRVKNKNNIVLKNDNTKSSFLKSFYLMNDSLGSNKILDKSFTVPSEQTSTRSKSYQFESTTCQSQTDFSEASDTTRNTKTKNTSSLSTSFVFKSSSSHLGIDTTTEKLNLSRLTSNLAKPVSKTKRYEFYEDFELFSFKLTSVASKNVLKFNQYKQLSNDCMCIFCRKSSINDYKNNLSEIFNSNYLKKHDFHASSFLHTLINEVCRECDKYLYSCSICKNCQSFVVTINKIKSVLDKLMFCDCPKSLPLFSKNVLTQKKKLRILSLFDGIGAGILSLKNNNFVIEKYYSSEIDENCINILKKNHPEIIHLGDVTKLDPHYLCDLGINLVIGGSPCNDMSGANPKKKGISNASGTGVLFYEFTRVLNILEPACFKGYHRCSSPKGTCETCKPTPFYWLFENVKSMTNSTKRNISHHLSCEPKLVDAICISPARRERLFWSNIPGMDTYTLQYRQGDPKFIKDCLIKERDFKCKQTINTILSKKDSINIHESDSKHNSDCYLYSEEIEKVMGMPPGYTEIEGLTPCMRRKLIAKSWSVQCVTQLLSLLDSYFETSNSI